MSQQQLFQPDHPAPKNKRQELKRKGNRRAFFLSESEQENINRIIEKRQQRKRLKQSTTDTIDAKRHHQDSENNPPSQRSSAENNLAEKEKYENKDVIRLDESDFFRQFIIQNSPPDTFHSREGFPTSKNSTYDFVLQDVAKVSDIAAKNLKKITNLEEKMSLLSSQVDKLKYALTIAITSEQEKNKKIKNPPVLFSICVFLIALGIIVLMIIWISR